MKKKMGLIIRGFVWQARMCERYDPYYLRRLNKIRNYYGINKAHHTPRMSS